MILCVIQKSYSKKVFEKFWFIGYLGFAELYSSNYTNVC